MHPHAVLTYPFPIILASVFESLKSTHRLHSLFLNHDTDIPTDLTPQNAGGFSYEDGLSLDSIYKLQETPTPIS